MHSHHAALHLQVIYSAYHPFNLPSHLGMYPQMYMCVVYVGEGKPDDNSRSVVGVTDPLTTLGAHLHTSLPLSLTVLDGPLVSVRSVRSVYFRTASATLQQIRNMERRALPLGGR